MGDTYWVRLNERPLPTLPIQEGQKSRARFENLSRELFAKRRKGVPSFDRYKSCDTNVQSIFKHKNETSPYPLQGIASFVSWTPSCKNGPPFRHFARITLHFDGEGVRFFHCPPKRDEVTKEKLPEIPLGIFFIDWDEDGDEDIAILLKSGQFVFYKQEDCERPIS